MRRNVLPKKIPKPLLEATNGLLITIAGLIIAADLPSVWSTIGSRPTNSRGEECAEQELSNIKTDQGDSTQAGSGGRAEVTLYYR